MSVEWVNGMLNEAIAELAEARNRTLKKDLKFKSGDIIPRGTPVEVEFLGERDPRGYSVALLKANWRGSNGRDYQREPVRISIAKLHKYVSGFGKPPGMAKLERMASDGVATTPTGKRVEPDGYGPDGSPSWLMALGFV